ETQPGVTRVVLDLEQAVEVTASQLSMPARLMIELRSKDKPVPSAVSSTGGRKIGNGKSSEPAIPAGGSGNGQSAAITSSPPTPTPSRPPPEQPPPFHPTPNPPPNPNPRSSPPPRSDILPAAVASKQEEKHEPQVAPPPTGAMNKKPVSLVSSLRLREIPP